MDEKSPGRTCASEMVSWETLLGAVPFKSPSVQRSAGDRDLDCCYQGNALIQRSGLMVTNSKLPLST
jgi:hypothetical protein